MINDEYIPWLIEINLLQSLTQNEFLKFLTSPTLVVIDVFFSK